ncbi:MAG: PTS sugar transporter subunit IIA [Planctomycetota bacterium]
MNSDDFDVESLADYLHLSPAQVVRMAERGHLPGRRLAGQWRFSAGEIHHWWESRLETLDDQQLAAAEGVLSRASQSSVDGDEFPGSITDLLPLEAIAVPLAARTRQAVIQGMVDTALHTGWLWDGEKLAEAIRARENLHSTALDNGVALLHPRRPMSTILAQPFLALGITHQGIPFGHNRGVLTDIFFLICSTDDRTHLRILARLSRLTSDLVLLARLRQATDAREARDMLAEAEAKMG